ncbi:MAG: HupE/UreJ family protein [Betaproteobacteria bacterium]
MSRWANTFTRVLAALCLLTAASYAGAHSGGTTGFATVTLSDQTVRYSLALSLGSVTPKLADAMHLGQPGAATDYTPLLATVTRGIHISSDGNACEAAPGQLTPPASEGANISIVLDFACAHPPRELVIHDDLFDTLGNDYHTLAKIEWRGGTTQFAFQPDARETHIAIASAGGQSSESVGSFYLLGIEHILTGYDHLLFLLALILRGGNVWSLFKIITAFTIAHSITLALAALNIVVLPSALVEATIALSIAYVAAENLFMRKAVSHRWAVSFVFGLVHGFGFSSVLRELGLPKQGLVWALLNFNLGVETGQAVAVLIAVPVLIWLRRFRWEPRAVMALSVIVLAVGLTLFVERALFTG